MMRQNKIFPFSHTRQQQKRVGSRAGKKTATVAALQVPSAFCRVALLSPLSPLCKLLLTRLAIRDPSSWYLWREWRHPPFGQSEPPSVLGGCTSQTGFWRGDVFEQRTTHNFFEEKSLWICWKKFWGWEVIFLIEFLFMKLSGGF